MSSLDDAVTSDEPSSHDTIGHGGTEVDTPSRSFILRVSSGPDVDKWIEVGPGGAGRAFIGQSALADLSLSDNRVSRRHLALQVADGLLLMEDLGSTNGTFVNGLRIRSALLNGGESVRMGETTLAVEISGARTAARPSRASRFGRIIGDSLAMRRVYPLLEKLAASNVPMVIEGETGTGKELVAESIHETGPRADAPFVVFDCTTVPPNLLESALFGHERGSFTGAVSSRQGVFEQAHRGTLFLDEIGDLEFSLQAKLLRALERREVQRVGGSTWTKVDVRIVAATRRDLEKMIQARTFRDDLFYRLAVARVELPALRDREGDVEILARYFWQQLGGTSDTFPSHALPGLLGYNWPGNVRELFNKVSQLMALGELSYPPSRQSPPAGSLGSNDGGPPSEQFQRAQDVIQAVIDKEVPFPQARNRVMREFERRFLEAILARHGGNVSKASRASGIQRRFFYVLRARQVDEG